MENLLSLPMPTRPLGHTGHDASVLALGGVNYCALPDAEAAAVVHRALDLGINLVDTAANYANGESERKIGLVMAERRNEVFLSTKTSKRSRDEAMASAEESLKRLQTDRIDLFFVHSIEGEEDLRAIIGRPSVLDAAEELRAAGIVRHIGLSGHNNRDTMLRCLQEYPFDAVLFPVGAANRVRYSFEETVLPFARQQSMAVMGMKLMLCGKVRQAADPAPYIRFGLSLPVDVGVVGVDSIAQLEQNVAVAKSALAPLQGEDLDALLAEAREITSQWGPNEWCWMPGVK